MTAATYPVAAPDLAVSTIFSNLNNCARGVETRPDAIA